MTPCLAPSANSEQLGSFPSCISDLPCGGALHYLELSNHQRRVFLPAKSESKPNNYSTQKYETMASASLRDSFNSLGWSRRDNEPVTTTPQTGLMSSIRSLNPFGDSGYVRLPTTEAPGAPLPAPTRREEEEGWFARKSTLSRKPVVSRVPCIGNCALHPSHALDAACDTGNPLHRLGTYLG